MTVPTPSSPDPDSSATDSTPSSPGSPDRSFSSPQQYGPVGGFHGAHDAAHGGATVVDASAGTDDRARVLRELREAAVVAAAVTVTGVLLGLLWVWLAPRIPLFTDGQAVFLKDPEGEEAIGADGTFVLLGLAVGAVAGALVFLARRKGGIGIVVGLACGALLASVVAWRTGVLLGPEQDVVATAKAVGEGSTFDGPLELKAKGALLAMPLAAVLVHLVLTGLFGPRDPEPQLPELATDHSGW